MAGRPTPDKAMSSSPDPLLQFGAHFVPIACMAGVTRCVFTFSPASLERFDARTWLLAELMRAWGMTPSAQRP